MWFENQFPYFLYMALCGVFLMFLYDFLRISRRLFPCPDFLVNLEDILFSALSAVLVFYVTYLKNNGEIRWQTAVGLMLGIMLYIFIVKDRWVKIGCIIIRFFAKVFAKILKIILKPVMIFVRAISRPCKVVFWYSGKGIKFLKIRGKITAKNIRNILRKK